MGDRDAVKVVSIPVRFWDDHCGRIGYPESGVELKRTARNVTVELTAAQWSELRSDAVYYSDPGMAEEFWADYRGVVLSARATLRRMNAQGS